MFGHSPSIPSLFSTLVAGALLSAAGAAEPREGGAGSSAGLAEAVQLLSSPQFVRREAAARTLANAGRQGIPLLQRAAAEGDLEAASRALEILREMLSAADAAVVAEAERAIEAVAAGTRADAAGQAVAILEFQRATATETARHGLEAHGALIRERPAAGRTVLEVEFTPAWTGGMDEWSLLTRLRGVAVVSVHGLRLDDAALELLPRIKRLRRVELFGTGCSEAAVAAVAARLPDAVVDVRRGGRLGVSAAGMGACAVQVQPGSAAARCGLRDGDVIVVADGRPVADFADFTAAVSLRAAGEEMALEVVRQQAGGDSERLKCTARLDGW